MREFVVEIIFHMMLRVKFHLKVFSESACPLTTSCPAGRHDSFYLFHDLLCWKIARV